MADTSRRPPGYKLVIGDKTYSSWSLRPWLGLRKAGIPFEEVKVKLRRADTRDAIAKLSPSGKVPLLSAGDVAIWDSLAILEYLAESHPTPPLWPSDKTARAVARAVSAEMHSGFQALREAMPMDFLACAPIGDMPERAARDIRRVVALWRDARGRFGKEGPFLFGAFSIADAMYAPVASRFRTYVEDLRRFGDDGTAAAYVEAIFAMPEIDEWERGAREELAQRSCA